MTTGSEFMAALGTVKDTVREQAILQAILGGNTPAFLDTMVPITVSNKGPDGVPHVIVYKVAPDYLAVGTNTDFVLMPMYPTTAQKIADAKGCIFPTYKMVNQIWKAAPIHIAPHTSDNKKHDNTSNSVYLDVNRRIAMDRVDSGKALGLLTAGHKKDIILSKKIPANPGRIFIYGWFHLTGKPIQGLPLYSGHSNHYVDYSHGVRLVSTQAVLDGAPVDIRTVLADSKVCSLISEEGPLAATRYDGP